MYVEVRVGEEAHVGRTPLRVDDVVDEPCIGPEGRLERRRSARVLLAGDAVWLDEGTTIGPRGDRWLVTRIRAAGKKEALVRFRREGALGRFDDAVLQYREQGAPLHGVLAALVNAVSELGGLVLRIDEHPDTVGLYEAPLARAERQLRWVSDQLDDPYANDALRGFAERHHHLAETLHRIVASSTRETEPPDREPVRIEVRVGPARVASARIEPGQAPVVLGRAEHAELSLASLDAASVGREELELRADPRGIVHLRRLRSVGSVRLDGRPLEQETPVQRGVRVLHLGGLELALHLEPPVPGPAPFSPLPGEIERLGLGRELRSVVYRCAQFRASGEVDLDATAAALRSASSAWRGELDGLRAFARMHGAALHEVTDHHEDLGRDARDAERAAALLEAASQGS